MLAVLVEASIRATLLIAAVAVVLRLMRIRTASVRHAVWVGVVATMLLLPATVAWGPKAALRWLPAETARTVVAPPVAPAREASAAEPVTIPAPVQQNVERSSWTWEGCAVGLYLAGLTLFLLRLGIGTVRVQWLMRGAGLRDGRRTHASCASPITVGCFRLMVILPPHWPQWPEAQLQAVLAHEQAHVSRRDPLFQWLGLFNRAIFWFHPLAWWLDRQLSGLAEEACDDIVLSQGYDPQEYSQYLVSIARSLRGDGTRVEMIGMAMPGAALPHRVRRMLTGARQVRTSRLRRLAVWSLCVGAIGAFSTGVVVRAERRLPLVEASATAGLLAQPAHVKADSILMPQAPEHLAGQTALPLVAQAAPAPATARPATTPPASESPSAAASLRFEVASVRPTTPAKGPGTVDAVRGGPGSSDPEHIVYERVALRRLIMDAYGVERDQIDGPAWAIGDPRDGGAVFDVSAKVPAGATKAQVAIMLQNLLKDRFQLTLHHTQVEHSGFALVTARGGPKLTPSGGDVADSERGGATSSGVVNLRVAKDGFPELFPGRNMGGTFKDGTVRARFRDYPIRDLVQQFSFVLAVHMIDKTGLSGKYDFTLEFTPPENAFIVGLVATLPLNPGQTAPLNRDGPNPGQLDSASIVSSAMEKQLGLKLEAAKIPVDTIVIDHAEKTPTEN